LHRVLPEAACAGCGQRLCTPGMANGCNCGAANTAAKTPLMLLLLT